MQRHLVILFAAVGVSFSVAAASAETSDHKISGVANLKSAMNFSAGSGSGLAALKSDNALAPKAPSDKSIAGARALEPEALGKPKARTSRLTHAMFDAQSQNVGVKNNGLAALQGSNTEASDPAVRQLVSTAAKTSSPGLAKNFSR